MKKRCRGADVLVDTLRRAGVRYVFALSGNHIMSVFDALFESGINLIHTRHEAAAVHMADAWARITGETGVALVTAGPGHANAVSALYTAHMAEAPVVLLSGHVANSQVGMGGFQEMRQADMVLPVTKAAWVCQHPDKVASDVARAIQIAKSGRPGPVHLSLPTDVLEGIAATGETRERASSAPVPCQLADGAADSIIAYLRRASRPVVLVGPACMTRPGRRLGAELEEACGIPVIGMESPRGILDPSLGAFNEMLVQADCVLLLGKRLDFTLRFGNRTAFRPDCSFLHVDADFAELERARRALGERVVFTARADAFAAMKELIHSASRVTSAHQAWMSDVQGAVRYRPADWKRATSAQADRLHPVEALKPLQQLLDSHPEAVLVSDGGEFGQWAQACLSAPHRVINGMAGAIGSSLPYALAARCASPAAPVVAVLGDGTAGFHISEIDTAVRYALPFLAVIGTDARWNAEYQIQLRDYGADRLIGCELRATRYDLVATALGGHGDLVTQADAMSPAVERARSSGLPAFLNVMIEGLPAPQIRR